MAKIQIYYFSGSGNSLIVTEKIAEKLGDDIQLSNISACIENKEYATKAKTIGFVFPCHGFTIPIPVNKFLIELKMKKAKYIFGVVTRGGTAFNGFIKMNSLLKKKNKSLNAAFVINMPNNDPKLAVFKSPTYEEVMDLHKEMEKTVSQIEWAVKNKKEYHDNTSGIQISESKFVNNFMEHIIEFSVHNIAPKTKNYFYTNDDCIGCSTCTKICPSGKISLKDNKPVWDNKLDCYMCYACMNFCPVESIQIKSKIYMKSFTPEHGRYHHPHITAQDMIMQKENF